MVDRATEFAPVKDADVEGNPKPDTPAWARRMILAESTQWLDQAAKDGLRLDPSSRGRVEVSSLLSYDGSGFSWIKRMYKKTPLGSSTGGYIDHEGDYIEADFVY